MKTDTTGEKFRMLAIDMDGTLLSPAGDVTAKTRSAVQRVLATGAEVCFATGRNWTESLSVLEAVGHFGKAVFVGGAMVVDTVAKKTLHRTMMHPTLAAEVSGFFETRGFAALALQDVVTAGFDYVVSADLPMDETTAKWMTIARVVLKTAPSLARFNHEHTIRVGIVAPPGPAIALEDELQKQFGSRIISHRMALMAFGLNVLEVFDPAVNKWDGILHVAKLAQIDPRRIIAIGDDVNDLPMIRQAGLGVAMGNAREAVRAVAGRVIGKNSEDGLADFLEELVEQKLVGAA